MNILYAFPEAWCTTVTAVGPVHRDADGYTAATGQARTITGVLIAPGASQAPDAHTPAAVEATDDVATVYAPPGADLRHRDRVTVPDTHPMAGTWEITTRPAPWPLGLVATMTRR